MGGRELPDCILKVYEVGNCLIVHESMGGWELPDCIFDIYRRSETPEVRNRMTV